jgi:hypothetical protein
MSTWIIVAVVIVIVVVAVVAAALVTQARRRRLRERFGPEYDRAVENNASRRKAESELVQRERRVKGLDIRPLDPAIRAKYVDQWTGIQERFVDKPKDAVGDAHLVVVKVMTQRGYPTEDGGQAMADLSVDHAQTLDHYRAASTISGQAASGAATTEDLRQAMIHYRVLFRDLLGEPAADQEAPDPGHDGTVLEPDPGHDGTVVDEREDIHQQTPRT